MDKKFKIAAFGEVLWDLLPDASVLGGAPFNFTYRINSLGNQGVMISAVGKDELGKAAIKKITDLKLSDKFIQINNHPTGSVNVFFDEFKNPDYEIIKNVAYDLIAYNANLEELIHEVDCICFGTLAQRNLASKQTLLKLLGQFRGTFRFYDLNLRKECYSTENIISSLKHTDILKLNEKEAIELNNMLRLDQKGLPGICKKIIQEYRLKYCVATLEDRGSLAVSAAGEVVYTPGFEVKLNDPLGAGDAFSAAFIDALLRGESLSNASELGNRLGALVATKKGATEKVTQQELQDIAFNINRISDHILANQVDMAGF